MPNITVRIIVMARLVTRSASATHAENKAGPNAMAPSLGGTRARLYSRLSFRCLNEGLKGRWGAVAGRNPSDIYLRPLVETFIFEEIALRRSEIRVPISWILSATFSGNIERFGFQI